MDNFLADSVKEKKEEVVDMTERNDSEARSQKRKEIPNQEGERPTNTIKKGRINTEGNPQVIDMSQDDAAQTPMLVGMTTHEIDRNLQETSRLKVPDQENYQSASLRRFAFYLTKGRRNSRNSDFSLRFDDIVSGDFNKVVLSNFMFDIDWVFAQCERLKSVPITLIHGQNNHELSQVCKTYNPGVKLVSPKVPLYGTHHSKFMILFYPNGVRVAICTANFIAVDWENKTNGVWVQDFPLKTSLCLPSVDFENDLIDYLKRVDGLSKIIQDLKRFDFSSAQVEIVASTPGEHMAENNELHQYGHVRLKKLLAEKLDSPREASELVTQSSSVGSLDKRWLEEFTETLASQASDLQAVDDVRSIMKSSPTKTLTFGSNFHFIWPTVEDVRNSVEGWCAGLSLPLQFNNLKPYVKTVMRKWDPPACLKLKNYMPHIKTYARVSSFKDNMHNIRMELNWCLLTSANLSKAAWGVKQRSNSQLFIRSYELGVLFLPSRFSSFAPSFSNTPEHPILGTSMFSPNDPRVDKQAVTFLAVDDKLNSEKCNPQNTVFFPVPYQYPLRNYESSDNPWVWNITQEKTDNYGRTYNPSRL